VQRILFTDQSNHLPMRVQYALLLHGFQVVFGHGMAVAGSPPIEGDMNLAGSASKSMDNRLLMLIISISDLVSNGVVVDVRILD
jgi:hypothetical protein